MDSIVSYGGVIPRMKKAKSSRKVSVRVAPAKASVIQSLSLYDVDDLSSMLESVSFKGMKKEKSTLAQKPTSSYFASQFRGPMTSTSQRYASVATKGVTKSKSTKKKADQKKIVAKKADKMPVEKVNSDSIDKMLSSIIKNFKKTVSVQDPRRSLRTKSQTKKYSPSK